MASLTSSAWRVTPCRWRATPSRPCRCCPSSGDGEAFLRGIRGLPASRDVPVVLISAKEELPAIATRYGAAGYLSKPFEAPQLLSLIERVLQ